MAVAKIAQYGIKALTGVGRSLAKKQVTKLTSAQFCKVTRAAAKVQGNPFAIGLTDELCKSGKEYGKLLNEASKWAAREGASVGLPQFMCQGGKVVQKGKFTPKGKKMLSDILQQNGLPKDATVYDMATKSYYPPIGGKINFCY